jgi:hypothetical protein
MSIPIRNKTNVLMKLKAMRLRMREKRRQFLEIIEFEMSNDPIVVDQNNKMNTEQDINNINSGYISRTSRSRNSSGMSIKTGYCYQSISPIDRSQSPSPLTLKQQTKIEISFNLESKREQPSKVSSRTSTPVNFLLKNRSNKKSCSISSGSSGRGTIDCPCCSINKPKKSSKSKPLKSKSSKVKRRTSSRVVVRSSDKSSFTINLKESRKNKNKSTKQKYSHYKFADMNENNNNNYEIICNNNNNTNVINKDNNNLYNGNDLQHAMYLVADRIIPSYNSSEEFQDYGDFKVWYV